MVMEFISKLPTRNAQSYCLFKCSYCGKIIERMSASRKYRSCGCRQYIGKHGDHKKRLYSIWEGMKARCNNSKSIAYKRYGGRGIKICNEWTDYVNFKNWAIINGYTDILTIDRKNNDGNYCPENCRWVTKMINSSNGGKIGGKIGGKMVGKKNGEKLRKLTMQQATEIRELYKMKNTTYAKLSKLYKITQACIHRIVKNKSYRRDFNYD